MSQLIKTLLFISMLLTLTLACSTVTEILIPESSINTPASDSTVTPVIAPTIDVPVTETPIAEAACPTTLTRIMDAATTGTSASNTTDVGQEEINLVTYEVMGDQISNPYYEDVPTKLQNEQNDTATQEGIWNYFIALIPADYRQLISEYSIVTDGPDNTLAAVTQSSNNPNLWTLEVDIADSSDKANLTYTFIHEFGHLLTLGPDQVPPSTAIFNNPDDNNIYTKEVAACPQYFPGEGCSNPASYINTYYNQFWKDIYEEWQLINLEEGNDDYYKKLDDFYNKYQDQFVNDYAVTNPEEDIAESWSYFVLNPKPAGDTIAEQKILFFYNYPELVQLRGKILNNLCAVYPRSP